ncbi:MAG: hypothetical protein ACRDXB_19755 [Actinomycetes bacterium]
MPGKYDHLFVTDMKSCDEDMVYEGEAAGEEKLANVGDGYALMRKADVPESKIYATHVWIHESDERQTWVHEHVHDYDEVLMWKGNDPDNVKDLGGEIFMTIEGEEHRITTTGSVYIPAGVKHCPLGFVRVDRPFTFSALVLDGDYTGKRA